MTPEWIAGFLGGVTGTLIGWALGVYLLWLLAHLPWSFGFHVARGLRWLAWRFEKAAHGH